MWVVDEIPALLIDIIFYDLITSDSCNRIDNDD